MALVKLRNYSVAFKDRRRELSTVLEDIDLDLDANQIVGIIGPSGCGKTTLLKAFAGLLPLHNNCMIHGEISVLNSSPEKLRGQGKVSVALQSGGLLPWLSVLDNVLFPIRLHRKVSASDEAKASSLLAAMMLSARHGSYPAELSGGMLQRAAFARILMADPQVITCDEPLSSVDQITRDRLFSEVIIKFRSHVTSRSDSKDRVCFWATHSVDEIAMVADTVLVLSTQPARVIAVIRNSLPSDRAMGIMETYEFLQFTKRIKEALRK